LPSEGNFDASIDGAIGQIVIVVPEGMALRLRSNTAIANTSVPAGYQRADRIYTSPDYQSAARRVNLVVGMAIGNVTVRER
jgi:predicted membrane protein